jgi:CDP-diacylglycerol--glycerol-3-phosphate 3-phosphatidyltransferase
MSATTGSSPSLRRQLVALPNLITYFRILAVPVVLVVMQLDSRRNAFIAAMIFALASATDALDGYLARRFQMISDVGKFLDPLADKLITTGALVMLVHLSRVSVWVVIVLLSRDLIVGGLRSMAATEGLVLAARELGKQKTAFQMVGLWCLLVHYPYPFELFEGPLDFNRMGSFFLYLSVLLSVVSMIDYFLAFFRALGEPPAA